MTRVVVALVAAVLTVVVVITLRNTAMTVHTKMPADSKLLVHAHARWRGERVVAANRAQALAIQCTTETSDRALAADFQWDEGRFTFEVLPALDEPDRRQLKGCLSDLRMPLLIVDVERMQVQRT
jgi:hypothetical protein